MARTRFPRRSGNCLAGDRFAARCFFRPAAFGAHGATSVADVCRSAADSAGRALSSPLARAPKKIRARRSGPILNLAGAAPGWNHTHASAELLAHNGGNALCLARAGGVRSRAPLARLAQIRARLFSRRLAPLLVAGSPPFPQPSAVAALVRALLPARGGFVEHDALRNSHLLRPCALSHVFGGPQAFRNHRSRRPKLRGLDHVGARFASVFGSRRSHRH